MGTKDTSEQGKQGLGDGQGTVVGSPAPRQGAPAQANDGPSGRPERQTGTGSEATEGMHNAKQGGARDESATSGLTDEPTGRSSSGADRSGSEPLVEGGEQHRSGYGGAGGKPVTSSDTREPKEPK